MSDLINSRVLITGGAGFVGSYVIEKLLKEKVKEIIIIDNLFRGTKKNIQSSLDSGKVKLFEGDIRDLNLVKKLMANIDYCYHLAAFRITHCVAEPRNALEVMYDGTFNVLEACVENKIKKNHLCLLRLYLRSSKSISNKGRPPSIQ